MAHVAPWASGLDPLYLHGPNVAVYVIKSVKPHSTLYKYDIDETVISEIAYTADIPSRIVESRKPNLS